jgi:hypothetical protein
MYWKSVVFRSLKEIPSACSHMIYGKNCHMMSYAASNLKLVTPKMTLQPHNATNPNNTRDRVPFMFLFMFKDILLFSVWFPLKLLIGASQLWQDLQQLLFELTALSFSLQHCEEARQLCAM